MRLRDTIVGNEKIADMLEKSYKLGKLPHAYLFEGPENIGKTTLAMNFSKLVLSESNENIKKSPDLIIISSSPGEKQIKVDKIRELEKKLSLYPYRAKYKIAIIEEAEKMNKSAANALLKTLEEPNETTIMILLTSNSRNIPDTIKSRCQILKFLPVKKEKLKIMLEAKRVSESEIEKIIELAAYKPGKALEFLENPQQIKTAQENIKLLIKIFKERENEKINEAEIISKKELSDIIALFDSWTVYLRKVLRDEYAAGAQKMNLLKTINKLKLIGAFKRDLLEKNVNIRLSIENLFLEMS